MKCSENREMDCESCYYEHSFDLSVQMGMFYFDACHTMHILTVASNEMFALQKHNHTPTVGNVN